MTMFRLGDREIECVHSEKEWNNGFCFKCLKILAQAKLDDPEDSLREVAKSGRGMHCYWPLEEGAEE